MTWRARAGLLAALVLLAAGCGDGGDGRTGEGPALSAGLTEFDPALLDPTATGGTGPVARARARLFALRPRFARVVIIWSAVQPSAAAPLDWDAPGSGGHGARAVLRALKAARDRAGGGFEPVVTFLGAPAWATRSPSGCEAAGANPQARAIAPAALPAYRALVAGTVALAREQGLELHWVSPWNEPNSSVFASPQRATCDAAAPTLAARHYAPLVRAARMALDEAEGEQELVLGEISSPLRPNPRLTGAVEFVRALPDEALCAGPVWAQHAYAFDHDVIDEVRAALDARNCPGPPHRLWITETGTGRDGPRGTRASDPAVWRAGCRSQDAALRRWLRDPRVDVAIQYTFREDPNFPVGLATADLSRDYPAYDLWRAWGGEARGRDPATPAPGMPPACRARPR